MRFQAAFPVHLVGDPHTQTIGPSEWTLAEKQRIDMAVVAYAIGKEGHVPLGKGLPAAVVNVLNSRGKHLADGQYGSLPGVHNCRSYPTPATLPLPPMITIPTTAPSHPYTLQCTAGLIEWDNQALWFVTAHYPPADSAAGMQFVRSFRPTPVAH